MSLSDRHELSDSGRRLHQVAVHGVAQREVSSSRFDGRERKSDLGAPPALLRFTSEADLVPTRAVQVKLCYRVKSFRISGSQPCLLQCRRIAARESSTSSRALLTCVMPPRAAYRLTAARYEFMAALYSAQSRSRSEQMRRIGLDRIAFGRELSAHGSRNRFLRPTYSMEFPKNAEFLSLNSGYVAAAERPLVLRKAGNYRFVTPDWFSVIPVMAFTAFWRQTEGQRGNP